MFPVNYAGGGSMTGYEAAIGAIRRAGAAAASAGDQVRGIDLAGPLSGVGSALPGSRSAHAAAGVSTVWAQRVQDWSRNSQGYGENLVTSADLYAASDQEAEAHLGQLWTPFDFLKPGGS